MRYLKIIVAFLIVIILGLAGYYFFFSKTTAEKELDVQSKKFYLMIENYSTPVASLSVSSIKRSNQFYGKVISTRCRITDFKDIQGKQGFIKDSVRVDKIPFLFVEQKIPDGKLWGEYLLKISDTDAVVIAHGLLIETEKKTYFVPQRFFSPDNKNIRTLLQEINSAKNNNK